MASDPHYLPPLMQITPYGQMMMPYHPHMLPMMMDPMMAQPAFSHGMSSHSAQQLARTAAAPQAGSATQQQQQHPQQQHQQQHKSQQQPVLLPREPSAHGEAWNEAYRDKLFKNLTTLGMFQ